MATYKLIQDIEAEDHILGPLTFRQFIYSLVAVFFGYLSVIVVLKHLYVLIILFLPPGLLSGFLAFPFKSDQPTEVWALSKLNFLFKPRKRIWSQSGIKDTVTITAPKHIETHLTNGLSQTEVVDRLQALATTIDSRGWVVKNMSMIPVEASPAENTNERLIDVSSIPKPVPDYVESPEDDILDEQNNPIAAQMNNLITNSSRQHRQQLIDSLSQTSQNTQNQTWLEPQTEATLSNQLKNLSTNSSLATKNLHIVPNTKTVPKAPTSPPVAQLNASKPKQPDNSPPLVSPKPKPSTNKQTKQKTHNIDPAILNLAANNYLNVATIAREADKTNPPDEVIINLH